VKTIDIEYLGQSINLKFQLLATLQLVMRDLITCLFLWFLLQSHAVWFSHSIEFVREVNLWNFV